MEKWERVSPEDTEKEIRSMVGDKIFAKLKPLADMATIQRRTFSGGQCIAVNGVEVGAIGGRAASRAAPPPKAVPTESIEDVIYRTRCNLRSLMPQPSAAARASSNCAEAAAWAAGRQQERDYILSECHRIWEANPDAIPDPYWRHFYHNLAVERKGVFAPPVSGPEDAKRRLKEIRELEEKEKLAAAKNPAKLTNRN